MTDSNEDPYAVLNVPHDATTEEIKRSFRRLALELHPDTGGDPDDFRTLQDAYDRVIADRGGGTAIVTLEQMDLERFAERAQLRTLMTEELVRREFVRAEALQEERKYRANRHFLVRSGVTIPTIILALTFIQAVVRIDPTTVVGIATGAIGVTLVILGWLREEAMVSRSRLDWDPIPVQLERGLDEIEELAHNMALLKMIRRRLGGKGPFPRERFVDELLASALELTRLELSQSQCAFALVRWEEMGLLTRTTRGDSSYVEFAPETRGPGGESPSGSYPDQ